jgi:aspartate-semialdehyde dehydrogenase
MGTCRICVVGATGAVGREMLRVLERSDLAIDELRLLASARSVGTDLQFHGRAIAVQEVSAASFDSMDYALFSAGAQRSRTWAPVAVQAGAVVIDNSSAFRMQADVPLVVPEINPHALDGHHGIIANPNCSTIQMVMALQAVRDLYGLERVVVATYQSVSGAGTRAMEELQAATRALLDGDAEPRDVHPRGIAFDCIPQIDVLEDDGWSREENKMRDETRKILELQQLPVTATCVRVPVQRCHSEAVWVRTQRPVVLKDLIAAQQQQAGLQVASAVQEFRTARELSGRDEVHVGRMRLDQDDPCGLSFWVVSDNLLKGAALNAVQIVQYMQRQAAATPEAG